MIRRNWLVLVSAGWLMATASFAHPHHGGGASLQALVDAHTENVKVAIQEIMDSGLLSAAQAANTRRGLETFLKARAEGQRDGWTAPSEIDPAAFVRPSQRLRERFGYSTLESRATPAPAPEAVFSSWAFTCIAGDELLLNGRFIVRVTFQDLNGTIGTARTCGLTPSAGYFFFLDIYNVEIPIKMLDACETAQPASNWVFAAGLTNYGVQLSIFDVVSGIQVTYTNPTGQFFQLIIDQQTPWPCF